MSYPQPSSDQYATSGFDLFRLQTALSSGGDLYESLQSGFGFAIGPASDIANVNIAYFDPQQDGFMNQIQIGPGRAWTGRIDARSQSKYSGSNRDGKILIWPSDVFDPLFLPTGIAGQDGLQFVRPFLDVIQYFKPPQSLGADRIDKIFRFQQFEATSGKSFVIIPYWGRKFASIRTLNLTPGNIDLTVTGVTYFNNDNSQAVETPIDTSTIATSAQDLTLVRSATLGMFDALMLTVEIADPTGPSPIQVVVSDTPS